jgi:hypothetical protein
MLHIHIYIRIRSVPLQMVQNDKSKNEQIKSMLRVIDRIALNTSSKNFSCPIFLFETCGEKTDISPISFYLENDVSLCSRQFFSYYITLIIIYRIFFIQLSIVHILIKWIQCSSKNDLSDFYQSCSALYRKNIDNDMLVIIIRCISKCICILF